MSLRRAQRGFTLIELMIALVISSTMVLMVLGMFSRMSSAYRSQQQITQVQVALAAAQNLIEQDIKRAGFQLVDGFNTAFFGFNSYRAPIQITNDNAGPDQLRIFAADGARAARVMGTIDDGDRLDVDDASAFAVGDLAFLVNAGDRDAGLVRQISGGADTSARVPAAAACLVRITRIDATEVRFDTNDPWGSGDLFGVGHCQWVSGQHNNEVVAGAPDTMMYAAYARAYRIDPTVARAALGVLQMSPTGGLVDNDWQDLGLGFTDLQLAIRVFEEGGARAADETADPDDLPNYDWYSGEDMELTTGMEFTRLVHGRITQVNVSLVARTDRDVDDIFTRATPVLMDPARPDNNDLGDRDAVDLTTNPPAALAGRRIYRYSINRVDARNTGSGL